VEQYEAFMSVFQSIWTLVVMVIFLGVFAWAYSSRNKQNFEDAGRLPLDDDDSIEATNKEQHHHV
jgi:cytochrome c oxidase cbb3-type subunit 4